MHSLTSYDAVSMIHDVIITHNPFPYTTKFMFVGVRYNKTQQGLKMINSSNLVRYFLYTATLYTYLRF